MNNQIGMKPTASVASKIRHALEQRGLTQAEVTRITGLSQPQVSRRLAGERRWQVDELVALSRAWGVSVDELIGGPGREEAAS